MYVYVKSEPSLWTVGFYAPDGKWNPESDHGNREEASKRVAELNGNLGGFNDTALSGFKKEFGLLSVEFGYRQCEKGNNLETALDEFRKLTKK